MNLGMGASMGEISDKKAVAKALIMPCHINDECYTRKHKAFPLASVELCRVHSFVLLHMRLLFRCG